MFLLLYSQLLIRMIKVEPVRVIVWVEKSSQQMTSYLAFLSEIRRESDTWWVRHLQNEITRLEIKYDKKHLVKIGFIACIEGLLYIIGPQLGDSVF